MKKFVLYFVILSILLILFSFIHFYVLDYKGIYIGELFKNLNTNQINKVKANSNHFEYYNLVSISLILLIKVLVISLLFLIVSLLLEIKLKYQEVLQVIIKAEFVFLLPILYEIFYFKFVAASYTIADIDNFSSLSILNAIGYKNIDFWFYYPLQTLNLFELAYCFLLVYFLVKITKISKKDSFKIMVFGYIPALILWVTLSMFITLNKS